MKINVSLAIVQKCTVLHQHLVCLKVDTITSLMQVHRNLLRKYFLVYQMESLYLVHEITQRRIYAGEFTKLFWDYKQTA